MNYRPCANHGDRNKHNGRYDSWVEDDKQISGWVCRWCYAVIKENKMYCPICGNTDPDYKCRKFAGTGFLFHCQLKATTTSELRDHNVIYDMKVEAYNKLVGWEGSSPCILVLFRLPKNSNEWLSLDEEQLLLKNCCYWEHVTGSHSTNNSRKRLIIPRSQTFTPDTVIELLEKVSKGELQL